MSRTVLDVQPSTYAEILSAMELAGYNDQFHEQEGRLVVDLHGIALRLAHTPGIPAERMQQIASRLPPPRVIYGGRGRTPYLSRYYLFGAPRMPDGTAPFDEFGDPRPGIEWSRHPVGLYLHRFHRSDEDCDLHGHPWRWAVSLLLSGGYSEERRGKDDVVRRRLVRPGMLNVIRQSDFHRVDLVGGEAWSLFVVGPKVSSWGFWNRHHGTFTPWREFLASLREGTPYARSAVSAQEGFV